MSHHDFKHNPEYEICLCHHVRRHVVEELIRREGITTLKELCEVAAIGNKCGGCREDLEMLLKEINESMDRE